MKTGNRETTSVALSKEIPRTKPSYPVLLKLTNERMSLVSYTWGLRSPLTPATAAVGQIVMFNITLCS